MKKKQQLPTKLVIHFSEKCVQVIRPTEDFFKTAKGQSRIPSLEDWKELAQHIIGTKSYLRYETATE